MLAVDMVNQEKSCVKVVISRGLKDQSLPNQGGLKTIFNGTPRGAEMPKRGQSRGRKSSRRGAEVFEEGEEV